MTNPSSRRPRARHARNAERIQAQAAQAVIDRVVGAGAAGDSVADREARRTGGARIPDLLARDHREIERLITALAALPSHEPGQRTEVFARLQALLLAHARAEEEVVYRRLQQRAPDEPETLDAFEEHHLTDVLLQELASDCPGGPGWAAKVRVLEEVLRHHIKQEELHLFAVLGDGLDAGAQVMMGREFRALKHEALEALLGPIRRATPAFAGRATIYAQAAAGRYLRRGELALRHALSRLPA